jgi:hypothetical protein
LVHPRDRNTCRMYELTIKYTPRSVHRRTIISQQRTCSLHNKESLAVLVNEVAGCNYDNNSPTTAQRPYVNDKGLDN